ncbi:glycosyltransferase family 4 protein [Paenibacillus mesophilus]|uniref:glycosyltransferase family 4 protein n=1 Tax=Paenibacillus mesophilus TaxID=2582849 RepID=UPI001EE4664F|nr:glycosyltransferase family 4 protein [Paenibacillus mesophilus]
MYTDLAQEFHRNGHCVCVATVLESKFERDTCLQDEQGLNVLRIKCGDMFNVGLIKKGLSMISLPGIFIRAIDTHFKNMKFDLVVYPTPPITFASVANYIKRRDRCKSYLILRDIFPQNARDLGMMAGGPVFAYFRRKERKLYAVSDHIGCMSKGNVEYVLKHNRGLHQGKLELLPNWKKIGLSIINPDTSIKAKYGLENKFVAIFGGNLGKPQELGFLLELAALYRNHDHIAFLIIGDGTEKQWLKERIRELALSNVHLKERVPTSDYDELVRACDVGLINLNRRFTIPNIPSKTLSYFEAGIPILAAVDPNTDYGDILKEAQAGLCSVTGELDKYRENFEKLYRDRAFRQRLGANGRKYLEQHWTVEQAYKTITRHLVSI